MKTAAAEAPNIPAPRQGLVSDLAELDGLAHRLTITSP